MDTVIIKRRFTKYSVLRHFKEVHHMDLGCLNKGTLVAIEK